MATNGEWLKAVAERNNVPLRTLAQVQETLAKAKRQNSDDMLARLMLKAGRLETDAREWLAREYPQ